MLFVNILIMLFVAVLVLFALRKRIKASKDNQPVYDDNGILIGYVDKNMMFHEVNNGVNKNRVSKNNNLMNKGCAPIYIDGKGRYNPIPNSPLFNPLHND